MDVETQKFASSAATTARAATGAIASIGTQVRSTLPSRTRSARIVGVPGGPTKA